MNQRINIQLFEDFNDKESRMFTLERCESVIEAIGWLQKMGTALVMEKVKSVGVDVEGDRQPEENEASREKIQEA